MSGDEQALIDAFVPVLLGFAEEGRVSVALGGSRAKKRADVHSDYDFRVYADRFVGDDPMSSPAAHAFDALAAEWGAKGVRLDGVWARRIGDIERELDEWLAGTARPTPLVWSVWGYHLPTDIVAQQILHDPSGVLGDWRRRLSAYPPPLRTAILREHLESLAYWRGDYHYRSKVIREDRIFLAGLTAKLVHSLYQVVFALNETYYVGDGFNDRAAEGFAILPDAFNARVLAVLAAAERPDEQYRLLMALVDETGALAARHG
jgi:hypothetical protein